MARDKRSSSREEEPEAVEGADDAGPDDVEGTWEIEVIGEVMGVGEPHKGTVRLEVRKLYRASDERERVSITRIGRKGRKYPATTLSVDEALAVAKIITKQLA